MTDGLLSAVLNLGLRPVIPQRCKRLITVIEVCVRHRSVLSFGSYAAIGPQDKTVVASLLAWRSIAVGLRGAGSPCWSF